MNPQMKKTIAIASSRGGVADSSLVSCLEGSFTVVCVSANGSQEEGLRNEPDIVLLEAEQSSEATLEVVGSLRARFQHVPLFLCARPDLRDDLNRFLSSGVSDFVIMPEGERELHARVQHLLSRRKANSIEGIRECIGMRQLVGESPVFAAEMQKLPVVAESDVNVLITGETGTGKELVARAIHYLSKRSGQPFIPVNCGAIPIELFENEFFGHAQGAYTGAGHARPGLVQEAEGGTLFLDEVDCLPPPAQVKVLRLVQERECRSLGSTKVRSCNVRLIAASNVDIEEAVQQGRFRRDLFYRLNVVPITIPPLRDRRTDIIPLARYFLRKYCAEFQKDIEGISPSASQLLECYSWPGNIRELEHTIERAVVLTSNSIILPSDIHLSQPHRKHLATESFRSLKAHVVAQFEKSYLQDLLRAHNGNISQAARAAKKNRRAFWELMRKYRIAAPQSEIRV